MNKYHGGNLKLLLAACLGLALSAACGERAETPPANDQNVPPENGNIEVPDPNDPANPDPNDPNNPDPNDPDPVNPNDPNDPDPNDPDPVIPVPEDCDNLLVNGSNVNCTDLLGSAEAYCANALTVEGDPASIDFELVGSCGSCDATFYTPPAGADALCLGVVIDNVDELPDSTCKTCHAPNGYDGGNSIEDPHVWSSVDCTACHGGDGAATNPVFAHVCPPPAVGNRQLQILDTRAFFLSFSHAGVQFLPDYTCATQGGGTKTVTALEWLAFQNPGDVRAGVEGMGCGACHGATAEDPETGDEYIKGGNVVAKVKRSTMGNATGLNSGTRHGIGAANKFAERQPSDPTTDWSSLADYGATYIVNPDYDADSPYRVVGEVGSLAAPEVFTGTNFLENTVYTFDQVNNSLNLNDENADNYPNGIYNNVAEQLFQEVLNQACTGCHLQNNYNNNRAGDYRSNGCTACHFQVGTLGRSGSQDPNSNKYEPIDPNNLTPGEKVHLTDHRIRNEMKVPGPANPGLATVVTGIADTECIVCHEGSNRTVAQYHGYRLDQNQDLVNANFYPSQNTVLFTLNADLFGQNQNYNNRNINQWIKDEIWQADVANILQTNGGQDETPPDVHHEAGLGCIDCHGTGSTHGTGAIYSRMKVQTHTNDMLCETCHGTIDAYARHDGANLLDQADAIIPNTYVTNGSDGDFWLVSKLNGSAHYIPQTKDTVDASGALNGNGKTYPPGTPRAEQPIFNWVASYAMGRFERTQDLTNGFGPIQLNNADLYEYMHDGFDHTTGDSRVTEAGLECYTCHAAWQNNCIGCHLDAEYDDNPANFFYSFVSGERIYFNFNANFVYQNPINFMMGINDRGKISPYQGLHRFFSYQDLNNNTSNRISYGDRNGLGNDPQFRNNQRNNLPALQNQPFTPHSIRSRYSDDEIGAKGCLDCHLFNANNTVMWDQNNNDYNLTDVLNNFYATAIPFNVNMHMGLGSNLWLFDANGDAVFDTNNTPVYDLDRIVEANTGVTNSSSNHPSLDYLNQNPDYTQVQDTNGARMARPLTAQVLQRLDRINNIYAGLGDVYYYNSDPANDPNDTFIYTYFLNDYNYFGQ